MKRWGRRIPSCASFLALVWLSALPVEARAQAEVHERAIAEAYTAWVETVNAKDLEAWSFYLAPDAMFFPPDSPVLVGKSAMLGFYSQLFADSRFSLDCRLEDVEVAAAEDMAWAHGHCSSSFTGADSGVAHGSTKWVKVWKRQPNGEWKCAVNAWNAMGPG